jgi:hypothetical protein
VYGDWITGDGAWDLQVRIPLARFVFATNHCSL